MINIDGIIFSLQQHGGITVYFRQLLEVLAATNESVDLILEMPTMQGIRNVPGDMPVTQLTARTLERFRPARLSANASVFHSSYYRLPERRSVPTVVTVHDFIHERFRSGPRKWAHVHQKHAAIRAAQAVICISESTRQDLLEFVGETPGQTIHVIHNGVAEIFCPIEVMAVKRPFMLFVGERAGYKNFRLVLDALKYLPDLELHCVGGGALRTTELQGLDEGLRSRVRHLGFVTGEALNTHYNHAHCLVYPSSYEGFGIPVIEAMRAGCPVVSTDCKAVREVGGGALTVAQETSGPAFADAVLKLYSGDYRSQKINQGLEIAQGYSWSKTHAHTLGIYRSLGADLSPTTK